MADDSGATRTFGLFVGLLLALFIGIGLSSASDNVAGKQSLVIETATAD